MLVDGFNTPTSLKKVMIPIAAVGAFTSINICKDVLTTIVRAEEVHSIR